jgi:enediyne biosynthesis protein E5
MLGASFQLFTFFMITDPKTTPPTIKARIFFALLIALVDAYLRIHSITNSLFYASFIVTLFVGLPYRWNRAKNSKWEFHIQEKK